MNLHREKMLLRSIAASWGKRRNFSNFKTEEVTLFLKLQSKGFLTVVKESDESEWVTLTNEGEIRLYTLNRELPS